MAMNLINVHNLYKTYLIGREISIPVLKGVSFNIAKGEFISLMGASGSGKTTLMNILACLDRATSGKYNLDGDEISKLSNDQLAYIRNKKIGFVFQNFNLLPKTSALENVIMPLSYASRLYPAKEAQNKGINLLCKFGLKDRLFHEPSQLSGGQQQRIAIARALINDPEILMADEPTGNLDSKTGEEVLDIFKELNKDRKITIILVTHDRKVASHTDRIIFIKDGLITNTIE